MITLAKEFFKNKRQTLLIAFSVPIICVLLGLAGTHYFKSLRNLEFSLIQAPKVNDIYIIDTEVLNNQSRLREKYLITQVESFDEQNIHLKVSNFVFVQISDAIKSIRSDKLLTHKYFSNERLTIPKANLEKLWLNDGVSEVGRSNDGMHLYGGVIIAKPKFKVEGHKHRKGTEDNQLAIALYQGNMGYEKNWEEAFRLFKKAAKDGNPYSQISLAQMYRDGEAVEVNFERALYWFHVAKNQGISSAKIEYSQLCQQIKECTE